MTRELIAAWIFFFVGAIAVAYTTDYARDRWPVTEMN